MTIFGPHATTGTDATPAGSSLAPPAPLTSVRESISAILAENESLAARISASTGRALDDTAAALTNAQRVFVTGAGRSGLALRMTAMRLMHLGLVVHVVGDVTTPAITAGDLLLVVSGSGTTSGSVRAAEIAAKSGATTIALTTAPESPLARLAHIVIELPAAQKLDHGDAISRQYSGSLFEQAVVWIGDALFYTLWQRSNETSEQLWPRHANLE